MKKTHLNLVALLVPVALASNSSAADFRTVAPVSNMNANPFDWDGGGIAVSNDGGFFDYNDGFITYKNLCCNGGLRVHSNLSVVGAGFFEEGVPYYGAIANIHANSANATGGGIAISDDGGFFDFNDGYITYKNLCCGGGLKVDATLTATGNIDYAGQQTKLDVADNFVATVRCADFTMGHSGRRGSPGRALVDWGSTLVLNWGNDWANAAIGSNLGIGTVTPGAKLHAVNAGGVGIFSGDLNPFGIAEFESNVSSATTHAWFAENGNRVFSLTAGGRGYFASDVDVIGQVRATTLLLTSDRNAKSNFRSVDNRDVLEKLSSLSITTWDYTNAPSVRHIGPMAQDFKAAFNLGEDDKHIATVDADGVLFASVKALHDMMLERDAAISALKQENAALKTELTSLKSTVADRLAALEKALPRDILQASVSSSAAR